MFTFSYVHTHHSKNRGNEWVESTHEINHTFIFSSYCFLLSFLCNRREDKKENLESKQIGGSRTSQ